MTDFVCRGCGEVFDTVQKLATHSRYCPEARALREEAETLEEQDIETRAIPKALRKLGGKLRVVPLDHGELLLLVHWRSVCHRCSNKDTDVICPLHVKEEFIEYCHDLTNKLLEELKIAKEALAE